MKRAILYARVSTPQQSKLYSLDYQIEQERSYASDMGFEIVAEFQDDQSGRKMERDGLVEARAMLAQNQADVLVTWKLDRLHRSYVNTIVLRDEIQKMGKELHYAQMRQKAGTRAKERLPEDILALMAEIETDEISERTQMGKRQKALAGKWIGFNKPPFGYNSVGKRKDVTVEINPEQARVVQLIFQWYVYGDPPDSPMGALDIARKLSSLGIPSPEDVGNRKSQKKRGYAEWDRNVVLRILRRSAYKGEYIHYQRKNKGNTGNNVKNFNTEDYITIPFPVIVDPHTFDLAQQKLDNGRKLSKRNRKYEYLVAGRIFCSCGYKMIGQLSHNRYVRIDGNVTESFITRYRCLGKRPDAVRPCSVWMKDIKTEILDTRIWQYVEEEIADPSVLECKLREIQSSQQAEKKPIVDRLATLEAHKGTIIEELKIITLLNPDGFLCPLIGVS